MISLVFWYVMIITFPMIWIHCCVNACWLWFFIHSFKVERPYSSNLNLALMIFLVSDWFKALSTHLARVILSSSLNLLVAMIAFLSFLNAILNGLKQETFKGWNACEVWKGRATMFSPNSCTYSMAFNVMCEPCPTKINKWQLDCDT